VSSSRATICSVVALFLTQGIASGQHPKRSGIREPIALLPAEQTWNVTLDAPTSAGGAMDAARVYVPLANDEVVALDRKTGEQLWSRAVDTAWPPLVHDGVVYLAGSELQALDAATGETRWRVPLTATVRAPLTYDTGWLLAIVDPGEVLGFRAQDGMLIWRRAVAALPIGSLVPGEGDMVYLSLADGRVIALSMTDGVPRWEQRLPGTLSQVGWGPGRVLVGSTDNFLYALDSEDGSLEWKWRTGGDVIGASYGDDLVYIASLDNMVRAVNRGNGNQRWRRETGTRPLMAPLPFEGFALVAGTNPTLSAFIAKDGRAAGTFNAMSDLQGAPLVDPDPKPYAVAIVLVMRDGKIAGLSPLELLFREQPQAPLTALPGRTLQRERSPVVR
jgi:outer membrane protein assembly factor BamB